MQTHSIPCPFTPHPPYPRTRDLMLLAVNEEVPHLDAPRREGVVAHLGLPRGQQLHQAALPHIGRPHQRQRRQRHVHQGQGAQLLAYVAERLHVPRASGVETYQVLQALGGGLEDIEQGQVCVTDTALQKQQAQAHSEPG